MSGATFFLLFWLDLDDQSFNIVRKFYLPPSYSIAGAASGNDVNKP